MKARSWLVAVVSSLVVSSAFAAGARPVAPPKPVAPSKTAPERGSVKAPVKTQAPAQAPAPGVVRINALNNGLAASGLVEVLDASGAIVQSGVTGADLNVVSGAVRVRISLSSGLAPQEQTLNVPAGGRVDQSVNFASGRFSLSISASDTSGNAKVYQGSVLLGSMGHGGQLSLPVGTYDVKVTHKGVEKWFTGVSLSENQLRNINATF